MPIRAEERAAHADHLACLLGEVDNAIRRIRSIATQTARDIETELLALEAAIADALSEVKDGSQYDKASVGALVESAAALFLRVNNALLSSRTATLPAEPPKTVDSSQATSTGIVARPKATLPVTVQPAPARREDPLPKLFWRVPGWLLRAEMSSGGNRSSGGAEALHDETDWYPRDVPGNDQPGIETPLDLGSTLETWTDAIDTDAGGGLFDIDFGSGSDDIWS